MSGLDVLQAFYPGVKLYIFLFLLPLVVLNVVSVLSVALTYVRKEQKARNQFHSCNVYQRLSHSKCSDDPKDHSVVYGQLDWLR